MKALADCLRELDDDAFRAFHGAYYGEDGLQPPAGSPGLTAWNAALRSLADEEYDRRSGSTLLRATDYAPALRTAARMMTDKELAEQLYVANWILNFSTHDPLGQYQYRLGLLLLDEQRRRQ